MTTTAKHIILGAGGAIGVTLARELLTNNESIKLVSRSGASMQGAQTAKADLMRADEVKNAIEEGSIVYLTAGLTYSIDVWRTEWPQIMENTIAACKAKKAKLIFFDNVYMYGRVNSAMTEENPINPTSKKRRSARKNSQYAVIRDQKREPQCPDSPFCGLLRPQCRENERVQYVRTREPDKREKSAGICQC